MSCQSEESPLNLLCRSGNGRTETSGVLKVSHATHTDLRLGCSPPYSSLETRLPSSLSSMAQFLRNRDHISHFPSSSKNRDICSTVRARWHHNWHSSGQGIPTLVGVTLRWVPEVSWSISLGLSLVVFELSPRISWGEWGRNTAFRVSAWNSWLFYLSCSTWVTSKQVWHLMMTTLLHSILCKITEARVTFGSIW